MTASSDVSAHVRGYLLVFGALLVLTLFTVAASYLQLPTTPGIALGLAIAVAKAGLVASVFMHLRHERVLIVGTLAMTVFFALFLLVFTLWSENAKAPGTRFTAPYSVTTVEGSAPAGETH